MTCDHAFDRSTRTCTLCGARAFVPGSLPDVPVHLAYDFSRPHSQEAADAAYREFMEDMSPEGDGPEPDPPQAIGERLQPEPSLRFAAPAKQRCGPNGRTPADDVAHAERMTVLQRWRLRERDQRIIGGRG